MAAAAALLLGSPAAFVAPGPRAWSPAFLSSGPGDQLRVLGVQRQRPPCQALVQWQGPCQAPVGRRPRARDVKRHAVVLACDRKVEEEERQTSLEVVQAVLRAVVSVIFVLACADTCTSWGLPTVRTGYACQPPAHRTCPKCKAAHPRVSGHSTCSLRVPALGVRAVRPLFFRGTPQVLFNGVVRVATAVFGATLLLNACGFGHRWVPEPPFVEVRPNPCPNPNPTKTHPSLILTLAAVRRGALAANPNANADPDSNPSPSPSLALTRCARWRRCAETTRSSASRMWPRCRRGVSSRAGPGSMRNRPRTRFQLSTPV